MKYRKINSIISVALAVIVAVTAMTSCNAHKKNTASARRYTAFITRYNIYYNGDKHYVETLDELEKKYEDDYTGLVYMHPVEAKNNPKAPQPSGDFNRSIEKSQKAIQLRSITKKPQKKRGKGNDAAYKAWMKRDEYNPFLHNAWMMMGRSQYMNGDFLGAASTFFYTSRHFSWLPNTVTEAKLWQARSYLGLDWVFEAENIITRVKKEELTNNTLQGLYNFVYADFYIKSNDYEKAAPYLEEAVRYAKGAQKTRLTFLLGQLYSRLGQKQKAYKVFAKVAGAASATYRTKFNARIKQSEVYEGSNVEPEVKALKRMTRFDSNKEYLDQIYYAIGNLYLSRKDTLHAIENYELAAKKSTRNGIEKAIAQITLGGLYYERRLYEKAQPCYSEAVPQLPDNYPNIELLKRRSDVLDELALYSQNVNLQDSLLRLSAMSPDAQLKVINKIIDELKKKEKEEADEAKRQEYLANQEAQGNNLKSNTSNPQSFSMNTDNSWYFYNNAAKAAGKTEFQRRWGSRKLEDDWRRRNKSSFNTSDFDSNSGEEAPTSDGGSGAAPNDSVQLSPEQEEKLKKENDPHFAEYYLKQIPSNDEEKATAHEVIQEGLYNMGVILKDKLEDFDGSYAQFSRLLKDYPDNTYRLDTYYNLYLMFIRMGNSTQAEYYRQLILQEFAESKYGQALQNPNYINNLRNMETEQQTLYENAFEAYMDNRNSEVHRIYKDVNERYPMTKLMPKFMFLEALAYVTERRPDDFNSTLRTMLEQYPNTDLAPTASAWLKGMAQGRQLQAGVSGKNMRGMIWSINLSNDSTLTPVDSINFALNPADRQLLVFVFPTDKVSSNELLYSIARHNFRSFVVKDFDLEQMNYGRLGMIVVKDFENLDELNHYRRVMAASTDFKLPAGVRPVVISVPNFDALLHSGGTLDDYFRFLEAQNYQDAQADILPYTEIETLDEADEAAAERAKEAQPEAESADDDSEEEIEDSNP
jgi:tetratricopeptide (TPR) repeat protein